MAGVIVDYENEAPVEWAHLEAYDVINNARYKIYSDSKGCFLFDNDVDIDSCRLIVTAFNYEPFSGIVKCRDVRPLNIRLKQKSNQLGEVTVTAEQVRIVDGGYNITPSRNQIKHSTGGFSLVGNLMIPGVEVNRNDGTITVAGEDATIYINGNEASTIDVKSLRAKDVAKVECFIDPSGKYSSKNRVINFILIERKFGGYVDAVVKQNIGYAVGDLDVTARIFNNNTQYTVYGGAGYAAYRGDETMSKDTIMFPKNPVIREQSSGLVKLRSDSEYLQIQVLNSNKKRSLRADVGFNHQGIPSNTSHGITSYSREVLNNLETNTETTSNANSGVVKLYGNFNFSDVYSLMAKVDAKYTDNKYNYSYRQFQSPDISSDVNERLLSLRGEINYTWTVNKQNTLSIEGFVTHKYSDADYKSTLEYNQKLVITEGDAFATWRYKIRRWSLMVRTGIALSRYHAYGHTANVRTHPRFNLGFGGRPRDGQFLRFSFNVGNTFPFPEFLTSARQIVDPIEVKVGNPNLELTKLYMPTIIYSVNIKKVGFQLNAYYMYMNRALTYRYCFAGDYLVQTYRTDGDGHFVNIDLSATWRPSNKFTLKGTMTYANDRYDVPGQTSPIVSRLWGKFQALYYIGNVAINADYGTPREYANEGTGTYKTSNEYGIAVSYALNGLQLEAGARNLFLKPADRIWRTSDQYHAVVEKRQKTDMSHGYIRIAYSFDFGKKINRNGDGPDRSSESAILRAN